MVVVRYALNRLFLNYRGDLSDTGDIMRWLIVLKYF